MLIKITDKCSMGCIHCLSDCNEDGKHMSLDTFKEAVEFNNKLIASNISPLIISGGEPFEHPDIKEFIDYLLLVEDSRKTFKAIPIPIIITTNGEYISKNPEICEYVANHTDNVQFQVVIDDRYYPVHVDESVLKKQPNVLVCYNVSSIYPQGRAITNNLPYERKSSSCYNVRALAKQFGATALTLDMILIKILTNGHISCSPHIDIDGNIKVGESRLCPVCSNIHKPKSEIVQDIIDFKCHQCDFINKNLPPEYRKFVE